MEDMTSVYGKGFRRIHEEAIIKLISKISCQQLQQKLKVLLDFFPASRRKIENMCSEERICDYDRSEVRPVIV